MSMREPPQDNVERLLASMDPLDPPVDFLQRVLERAHADVAEPRRQARPVLVVYACVYVAALIGLAVLAYGLGLSIARSGTGALLSTLATDVTLFADAPSAYLTAIVSSISWLHLLGVAVDLAILFLMTRLLLRGARMAPVQAQS